MKTATLWMAALVMALSLGACLRAETPKTGEKAPDFEAKDQDGKTWKLSALAGKQVVLLYFYPKDDTPGCTKEACGLRDQMTDLKKDNVQVLGVSFDDGESHKKFIAKHNLNFPLLVDTDGKIADQYGVRMPDKNMARRVSFLIGLDGKIAHVTDNPAADVHLNEMKDAAANLAKK
jgi:thioredoxin-dependent peroxiredoxin